MYLTLSLTEGTYILQPDEIICLQPISNYTPFIYRVTGCCSLQNV